MQTVVHVVKARPAPIPAERLRASVEEAARVPEVAARLPEGEWEMTVRVSGDRELHRLNRQFLDEDHPTDVLSFAGAAGESYLGDVVMSWDAVIRQAAEFGHSAEAEACLLAVHGFLHLLGWDHASGTEEREMSRLTVTALKALEIQLAEGRLLSAGSSG